MLPDLIALWPLALLVLLTTLFTEWAVRAKVLPYWISRKVLHVIAVGSCAVAPYFVEDNWSLIVVVLPIFLLLLVLVAGKKLMLDENGRPAWGIIWFPLAYLILLAQFSQPMRVAFPMLVLAICDPAATIFGKLFGKGRTYHLTGESKSFVGNLAFFISFLLVEFIFFHSYQLINLSWIFLVLIVGLLLTAVEALGSYGRDNLYIPLLTAVLYSGTGPVQFSDAGFLLFILLSAYPFYRFTVERGSLTPGGAISALVLGATVVFVAGGIFLLPLVVFFGSSVLVGKIFPHQTFSDAKDKQPRDATQVVCNGGVYLLLCVMYSHFDLSDVVIDEDILLDSKVATPSEVSRFFLADFLPITLLLALISIAVSTADTWASEVGQYFRQSTYDLLRFKRVEPGLSGGVSIAGTFAAVIGSTLIASLGFLFSIDYSWIDFVTVTSFGFFGMLIDSILGSLLQRQYHDGTRWSDTPGNLVTHTRGVSWISNDVVNLLANTVTVLLAAAYLLSA